VADANGLKVGIRRVVITTQNQYPYQQVINRVLELCTLSRFSERGGLEEDSFAITGCR
jgi:hypothetical protein